MAQKEQGGRVPSIAATISIQGKGVIRPCPGQARGHSQLIHIFHETTPEQAGWLSTGNKTQGAK
jgi:hypothetical protein